MVERTAVWQVTARFHDIVLGVSVAAFRRPRDREVDGAADEASHASCVLPLPESRTATLVPSPEPEVETEVDDQADTDQDAEGGHRYIEVSRMPVAVSRELASQRPRLS